MYGRRKSSSSFCRLGSIPGASSSGDLKRRRGEKQMFLSEALRRPDAGGRSTLTILARRCSDADGGDGSRVGARQCADRRAGGRSGWRRAACHSLLPRARIARHSAGPRVYPGAPARDGPAGPGRQAGAGIRGQVRDPREVSVEFEGVPLAEALHRMLGDQNFALVYGNERRLKSVRLLGGPQTAAAAAPTPAAAAPPASPPSAPGIMDAFAKHAPIAVAGHLGEALGGHEASLLQLFDLSVHHVDPTVRAEAARIVIGTIDTDPSLRASVLAQLNAMDDAALGALFRSMAGDNAQEVAMQIMTTARTSEFRSKASAVLQQLRAGG